MEVEKLKLISLEKWCKGLQSCMTTLGAKMINKILVVWSEPHMTTLRVKIKSKQNPWSPNYDPDSTLIPQSPENAI